MLDIAHDPVKRVYNIEDDLGEKRTLSVFVLKPFKADLKACSSLEEFFEVEKRAALRYSLMLISKRDYLIKQLEKKMLEKGFCKLAIQKAVQRCTEEGFLSDSRFVRGFIECKKSRYGPKVLEMRLKVAGADPTLVAESLQELCNDSELIEEIVHLLERKSADLSDFKSRQKWIAKLIRRGYSMTTIQRSFETLRLASSDQESLPYF